MDKKVYKMVSDRADGKCEVCGRWCGSSLELHHILRRKVVATPENCIMLCGNGCHRGSEGIHGKNGHTLDIKLKLKLQETYFDMGMTDEEVRTLMNGRLYLEGE